MPAEDRRYEYSGSAPAARELVLWRLAKDGRGLRRLAVYMPTGIDLRLMASEDFRRTQLRKDGPARRAQKVGGSNRAESDGGRRSSLLSQTSRLAAAVRCLLGGQSNATLLGMSLKARVRAGRLVVDEPTDLPEGTEVDLLALDPGDWLDEADRERLHTALRDSNADVATGRLSDAAEVLASLRSR